MWTCRGGRYQTEEITRAEPWGGSEPGPMRKPVGLEGTVRGTVGGGEGREGMGQDVQSLVGHREDSGFCFE